MTPGCRVGRAGTCPATSRSYAGGVQVPRGFCCTHFTQTTAGSGQNGRGVDGIGPVRIRSWASVVGGGPWATGRAGPSGRLKACPGEPPLPPESAPTAGGDAPQGAFVGSCKTCAPVGMGLARDPRRRVNPRAPLGRRSASPARCPPMGRGAHTTSESGRRTAQIPGCVSWRAPAEPSAIRGQPGTWSLPQRLDRVGSTDAAEPCSTADIRCSRRRGKRPGPAASACA